MTSTTQPGANRIRLSRRHEWSVYATIALVFSSGAAWAWLHHFAQRAGEFGESAHPAELWMQKLHGASAMLSLILLGTMLVSHVPLAWRAQRNRPTGTSLFAVLAFLIGTGYALYYSGNDRLRDWLGWGHLWIGVALPLFLALHVWRGKRRPAPGPVDESAPGSG